MFSTENRVADVEATQQVTTVANNETTTPQGKGKGQSNVSDKPRRVTAPVWKVLKAGSKKFDAQLAKTQTTETKRDCINDCVSKHYQDPLVFWMDFRTHADRLVDSKKFTKCCEGKGLDVQSVAEHVTFLGSAKINRVLRYGVEAVFGERIMMYNEPIYLDEANLYSKSTESKGQGADKKAS